MGGANTNYRLEEMQLYWKRIFACIPCKALQKLLFMLASL